MTTADFPNTDSFPSRIPVGAVILALACCAVFGSASLVAAEDAVAAEAPLPTLSEGERAHLIEVLESSRRELEALAARAHGEAWSTRPAPESWSPGEVVEHLVLSEEMFLDLVRGALAADPDPDWATIAAGGVDGIEANLADRSKSFQAPEMLQPTGEHERDELLGRFARARTLMLDLVRTTDAPVKEHTFEGPPGNMNVQQWLAVVGAHTLRHNRQIAEALEGASAAP